MSDLQIALIAIGALIIVTVLIINWWQERRLHRQVESSFSPLKRDALLDNPSLNVTNLSDTLDNPTTDHFSIESEPPEIQLPELEIIEQSIEFSVSAEPDNEFADLAENSAINEAQNNHEAFQDEVSIDSKLVNTQPDKPHAADAEATPNAELSAELDVNHHTNVTQLNSFKEALDGAKTTSELEAETDDLAPVLTPAVSLPAMLHDQIDLTALLNLAVETTVNILNNALIGIFDDFDKPVFVHVFDTNNQWHLLDKLASSPAALHQPVSKVACSIQLADRGGAISRSTLNRFQLAVETLGMDINADVEWQDAADVQTKANALDAFCIEVDKTIGFHLTHGENGAFTGTKLRGLAEAQGLTLGADGTFKYFNDAASTPSFIIFNRDGNSFNPEMLRSSVVKTITFQLDIPHVNQCIEAFGHMVQVARQMEIGLNAVLVDDNNRVLGDMQIEKIRQQLKVIQATMLVRGIVPGSDTAHRLFT